MDYLGHSLAACQTTGRPVPDAATSKAIAEAILRKQQEDMNACCTEAAPEPPRALPTAIMLADDQAERVYGAMKRLTHRLSSVLPYNPSVEGDDCNKASANAPLTEQVQMLVRKLDYIARALDCLTEAVEV